MCLIGYELTFPGQNHVNFSIQNNLFINIFSLNLSAKISCMSMIEDTRTTMIFVTLRILNIIACTQQLIVYIVLFTFWVARSWCTLKLVLIVADFTNITKTEF